MAVSDLVILPLSLYLSLSLRLGNPFPQNYIIRDWWLFILLPVITLPLFIKSGLYRAVLKYMGFPIIRSTVQSITLATLLVGFAMMMVREVSVPRAVLVIYWFVSILFTLGNRYFAHWILYSWRIGSHKKRQLAIYGAGQAGVMLADNLRNSETFELVAFFDDDSTKLDTVINSVTVHAPDELDELIRAKSISIILIAIPSLGRSIRRELLQKINQYPVEVRELPSVEKIINGQVTFDDVKRVEVEDILGREPVNSHLELLNQNITGKNVLVTGAGGSIGSELCRQIIKLNPHSLILYERSEYALYQIHNELKGHVKDGGIHPVLASVTDATRLSNIIEKNNINTIYHTAAYKHVPMVEMNPIDGVRNNIIGTYIVATKAIEHQVETFVLISTDKAVRPTNVMGASKRFAELILQGLNKQTKNSCLTMVRFGNVLDSAGSVVPLFREQIKNNGPVTVTHPEITRYFMSIPEAVQLVIQAGAMAKGGEVYVLDMGDPVKIVDLARSMIYLSGFTPKDENNPNGDIPIKFIGLRPGEKLYEELLVGDNDEGTVHPRIMCAHETSLDWETVIRGIEEITLICKSNDANQIRPVLKKYIPEYQPADNNK